MSVAYRSICRLTIGQHTDQHCQPICRSTCRPSLGWLSLDIIISWPILAKGTTGSQLIWRTESANMLIVYRPIVSINTSLRGAQSTQGPMIVLFQDLVAILKSCSSTEREIFDMVIRYLPLICTFNTLWSAVLVFYMTQLYSYLFLLSTLIY